MGQWRITIKTVLFKDYLSQHSIIPIFHYSRVMALPYAPCSMLHAHNPYFMTKREEIIKDINLDIIVAVN